MKNSTLILFLFFIILSGSGYSQNLILNPSGEEAPSDSTTTPTIIPHWTGDSLWERQFVEFAGFDSAIAGNYFFACGIQIADIADLYQDVDVISYKPGIDNHTQPFYFKGYIRNYNQGPPDAGKFVLECLDSAKTSVLYRFTSDSVSEPAFWTKVTDSFIAPIHTRYIRVHMIGYRNDGAYIDAYFDDLHLETLPTVTGIKTKVTTATISIYPNPVSSVLQIRASDIISSVMLYDVNGKVAQTENSTIASPNLSVQLSGIPNGIYILRAQIKNEIIQQKIIVQH